MKKLLAVVTVTIFGITLSSCGRNGLVIANWGLFLDDSLVSEFAAKHGIRVDITTYTSNAEAIGLMESGNRFDIVIPSEYAVQELANRNMIRQIDWNRLEELGLEQNMFHENLIDKLAAEEERFDLFNWGVPYKWGQLGIVYNADHVSLSDLERLQWNAFNDADFAEAIHARANNSQASRIGFYESAQDGFAVALAATQDPSRININSDDAAELDVAEQWLRDMANLHSGVPNPVGQGESNRLSFGGDDFHTSAVDGRYAILQKFSGCATLIIENAYNEHGVNLNFFVPDETNLFVNSMVIPSNARNVDLAYKFIAFVSSPENAVRNTMATFFTSTIQSVFDHVTGIYDLDFTFTWFGTPNFDAFGFFEHNAAYRSVVDYVSPGHVFFQHVTGRRTNLTNRWTAFRA